MFKFLIMFSVSFIAIYLVFAVGYIKRIADALEDFVYGEEEDEKESEAK